MKELRPEVKRKMRRLNRDLALGLCSVNYSTCLEFLNVNILIFDILKQTLFNLHLLADQECSFCQCWGFPSVYYCCKHKT